MSDHQEGGYRIHGSFALSFRNEEARLAYISHIIISLTNVSVSYVFVFRY